VAYCDECRLLWQLFCALAPNNSGTMQVSPPPRST
jgi:hypothetical protein